MTRTAADVVDALLAQRDAAQLPVIRRRLAPDEPAIGLRMKHVFDTAQAHRDLTLDEVDRLLDDERYEPRLAAFCILDFQVRRRLDDDDRRARHDLYLARHDRITTWDMVDRAAPRVVGGWQAGHDDGALERLAGSPDPLRRRTAITAPLHSVRWGADTELPRVVTIAGQLAADPERRVQDAVGIALRHLARRAPGLVEDFLAARGEDLPARVVRAARSGQT